MKRRIFRLLAFGLLLLLIAVAIGSVEYGSFVVLRGKVKTREVFGARYTVDPNTDYVPYVGYRYKPLRTNVRPGLGTDRHGFIHNGNPDRDLSNKASNVYRVFLLGDSTVAGNMAPQDTISAQLERVLSASSGRRVEVINSGVSGWFSTQELALISFYLADYHPDLIISLDGFNDVYNAIRAPREGWEPNFHDQLRQIGRAAYTFTYLPLGTLGQALGMIGRRTYVRQLLNESTAAINSRLRGAESDGPADAPRGLFPDPLKYYRRNLRLMIAASGAIGARHMAVLQPTVLRSNSSGRAYREPFLAELTSSWERVDYWGEKETLYNEARHIFRDLASEQGDNGTRIVRDYSALLDEETVPSFLDQAHYTAAAAGRIATQLSADVVATILVGETRSLSEHAAPAAINPSSGGERVDPPQ